MRTTGRLALLTALVAFPLSTLGAGSALAAHVSCGDTITQDTTLDSDLTGCTSIGIVVGADDITLDLNNHLIRGENRDSSYGVFIGSPHSGVTVQNGSIRGFTFGVSVSNSNDNVLRRLRVRDNVDGISLHNADHNTIDGNRVTASSEVGIGLFVSDANFVTGNSVTGARLGAIDVFQSDGNLVSGNSVSGATFGGIRIAFTASGLVEDNRGSDNGDGILVFPLDRSRGDVLLRRNSLRRNLDDGIDVRPPTPSSSQTVNVTMSSNSADKNFDLGIESVPGVTDGGGNTAKHNGNPLQCLNVACN